MAPSALARYEQLMRLVRTFWIVSLLALAAWLSSVSRSASPLRFDDASEQ